jgi:hypothetical protein
MTITTEMTDEEGKETDAGQEAPDAPQKQGQEEGYDVTYERVYNWENRKLYTHWWPLSVCRFEHLDS